MHGRQEFVLVAEVILTELARGIAQRLEEAGDGGIFGAQPNIGAGHTDLGQTSADRVLARDESRPPSGAALLPVIIGKGCAFMADTIDVRCPVAHLATAVVANVPPPDIVAPQNKDVRPS